jgi:hypothetical protein
VIAVATLINEQAVRAGERLRLGDLGGAAQTPFSIGRFSLDNRTLQSFVAGILVYMLETNHERCRAQRENKALDEMARNRWGHAGCLCCRGLSVFAAALAPL